MPPEILFEYLSVRLDGAKAAGKKLGLNMAFTDLGKEYGLTVENGVLNYGKPLAEFMGLLDQFPAWFNIVTP